MKKTRLRPGRGQASAALAAEIEGLGRVSFVGSARARRLNLRIRADGSLRLGLPPGASREKAVAFALSKRAWIEKKRAEIAQKNQLAQKLADDLAATFDPEAARRRLTRRCQELAARHQLHFKRLSFRRQKSRWGSCSSGGNLSLNLKLALLPERLSDLVVLHELAHLRIKNHGPEFHRLLEELCPGARELDRELNQYSAILRLPLEK
ncbi:MAG: DUF45 domain-containing protein [Deltaproteobacteria bacterium]|nr:DUF45 domain-containing protein [Deltaproteobacteria bacterium]